MDRPGGQHDGRRQGAQVHAERDGQAGHAGAHGPASARRRRSVGANGG